MNNRLLEDAIIQMFKDEARILELEAEVARLQEEKEKYEKWFKMKSETAAKALAELSTANVEITRLQNKCNKQALVLQRLTPEAFPGILFIHGEIGEKDANGLPEKLLVVPSYGCEWSQVYVKSERISGPEW